MALFTIGLFAALLVWAAWGDCKHYIIPNRLALAVAALYPIYILANPVNIDWAGGLLAGGGVLVVTWIFFALGFIGGGDAKLLSAASLWAGTEFLAPFILITTLIGGLCAAVILLWRFLGARLEMFLPLRLALFLSPHISSAPAGASKGGGTPSPVPYGVAIAAGGLWLTKIMVGQLAESMVNP